MDKVKLRITMDSREYGMLSLEIHPVPSHMGNLQRHAILAEAFRETLYRTRDNAQAGSVVLLAVFKNYLGSQADAEERHTVIEPFPDPIIIRQDSPR